jgi:hypothetical protein
MNQLVYIKMDGASILGAHILSFTEKDFIERYKDEIFMHHPDQKTRKSLLKSMYKVAQKTCKP